MEERNVPTATSNSNNVNVVVTERKSNGIGTAGFVLALLGLLFSWIPVVDWIVWFLGFLFSFIGVFKSPRGLAITGLIFSFIGVIIIGVLAASIFAAFK